MQKRKQYCTFHLGNLFMGVDVESVQEVLRFQEMTPVPLANDVVEGLINLRGQIVTALDLRRRLEIQPRSEGQLPMNVVVRSSDGVVSLLVDEIGDVVDVDDEQFEAVPPTLEGIAGELLEGVIKFEDRLLLVLNTERAA